jgi:aminotransferase
MTASKQLSESGTALRYRLMEMAATMDGVIPLGRGDPDLDTPAHIVQAAKEAIRRGAAQEMPPPEGLFELRQAIVAKMLRDNQIDVDPHSQVLVATGGQEALFLIVQALVQPGDEILMPDPRYTSYDGAIQLAGGRVVPVPTYPEDDFDLHPEEVETRISPRTKMLLLITPSNPTSGVISPGNLKRLAEIAIEHDLIVVSDEIYEHYVYDDAEHLSIASLPGMAERTVTLNGVSKAYAMTGWRVGYVVGPATAIAAMRRLKVAASRATSAVSQWAACAALAGPQTCIADFHRIYDERRQVMMAGLDAMGFVYGRPKGAFYVFPDASSVGLPAEDLCYLLLKEGRVLIFPGTAFGESGSRFLRISFLAPKDQLQMALARMQRTLEEHVW